MPEFSLSWSTIFNLTYFLAPTGGARAINQAAWFWSSGKGWVIRRG